MYKQYIVYNTVTTKPIYIIKFVCGHIQLKGKIQYYTKNSKENGYKCQVKTKWYFCIQNRNFKLTFLVVKVRSFSRRSI